ncbi:RNA polymerase sigma-70 factor (ECF subfamily) [Nocardioides cavernae]|uniref:RNA polymerase sigma-70 factor (ECF subfamily) n=1 Tax=Nocardioides cavernae TaxID=1921566 RepID=A0A7Y9GZK2_9ACTN|nr:SigE family RNA polymerase sigma factor [Nocardioides cavernae]NYE35254.1 RNA polymerase sigma-70 factor (ECF subfamily) [Nocardioides cavernae]
MPDAAERDFEEFYAATWPRTLAVVYALTGDRGSAEEIAQEAYVKAWSHWTKVSRYDQPAAWVRQVATRLSVSRWRRGKVAAAWLARNRTEQVSPAPDETSTALVQALLRLPEAQRRAIVLHHLADLPVDEVARIERCPAGTVKARLSRGRTALAHLLSDDPADETNGAPTHV